jgi:hypothetical protein
MRDLEQECLEEIHNDGKYLHFIKKNSVVSSPIANYTDRAIAAAQRS